LKCPKCGGSTIFPEGLAGENVCSTCGLVVEEMVILHPFSKWFPEWPSNWNERDSETLKEWLTALRTVSCQLNLPNFPYREEAARAIRKQKPLFFQTQKFGKNKRATIAALMHLILKEYGKERNLQEICQQLGLDNKLVFKQAWTLEETIKTQSQVLKIQRKSSRNYLFERAGKLTSNQNLLLTAGKTLFRIQKKGGNPISVAAGAFYYACKVEKVKMTKKTIGKAFCISDRTVDTNERKIRKHLLSTPAK
jgi:transcription initiation factor TFIIIB Brf1 subunit/transcription initiation factor TFIIB